MLVQIRLSLMTRASRQAEHEISKFFSLNACLCTVLYCTACHSERSNTLINVHIFGLSVLWCPDRLGRYGRRSMWVELSCISQSATRLIALDNLLWAFYGDFIKCWDKWRWSLLSLAFGFSWILTDQQDSITIRLCAHAHITHPHSRTNNPLFIHTLSSTLTALSFSHTTHRTLDPTSNALRNLWRQTERKF